MTVVCCRSVDAGFILCRLAAGNEHPFGAAACNAREQAARRTRIPNPVVNVERPLSDMFSSHATLRNMIHRVSVMNLTPGTTCYYKVESVRGDGTPLGGRSNTI